MVRGTRRRMHYSLLRELHCIHRKPVAIYRYIGSWPVIACQLNCLKTVMPTGGSVLVNA